MSLSSQGFLKKTFFLLRNVGIIGEHNVHSSLLQLSKILNVRACTEWQIYIYVSATYGLLLLKKEAIPYAYFLPF